MMGKKLPNGCWEYSLSNDKMYSSEKVCYEGLGVPVDIYAINTAQEVAAGKDAVLLKAVAWLEASQG